MPRRSGTSITEEPSSDDPGEAWLQRILKILRETRIKRGLPLRELTIKMKVHHAHLSRAERGLAQPGFVVLVRWCEALELDLESVIKEARESLKK